VCKLKLKACNFGQLADDRVVMYKPICDEWQPNLLLKYWMVDAASVPTWVYVTAADLPTAAS